MDVTQLPFNRLIGLEPAPADSGFLVSLPEGPQYTNHLGTVHASALLAVVEAGSGAFLLRHLGQAEGFVPVVRRLECKFRSRLRGVFLPGPTCRRRRLPAGQPNWPLVAGFRSPCQWKSSIRPASSW